MCIRDREMGDANPLSMMMNMANGGEDADPDSMDCLLYTSRCV